MRLTLLLFVTVVLGPATAQAVPLQLAHQGRLLDTEQAPLGGSHDLTFRLYDSPTEGSLLWEETVTESFSAGFYSTILGADATNYPLDDNLFATPPVYLELTVDDGGPLLPRQEINSVPYALRAGTAENVEGGYVDAAEISVDGNLVIDADGEWVGATPAIDWTDLSGVPAGLLDGVDADTLAGLSCADAGVAKFNLGTGLWDCATDLVLTGGEVLGIVAGSTVDLGIGSSVGGVSIATTADLDWSLLAGIPAGLLDGDDADTLAALGLLCADGDRAAWDTTLADWTCAPEEVGLGRLNIAGATSGQILTFNGTNVAWESPATTPNPPCTLTAINQDAGGALLDCGGTPLRLHARREFTQVSAGGYHTCGIESSGSIQCWGSNVYLQSDHPGGTFIQVSAGQQHTCGVDSNGSIQCWGSNINGRSTPPGGTFTQVSAGWNYTCGIESSGSIQCWGDNSSGQSTPPGGTFTQISAGQNHTCGIDGSGSVQCWGWNANGQSTPPGGAFTQVSVGSSHTCGIDGSGSVQCWGWNANGQSTPPGGTFTQVSAVGAHNCGIESSASIQCWGNNFSGQSTPPGGTFTQVSTGYEHTCGILQTIGTVACWGSDTSGQSTPP